MTQSWMDWTCSWCERPQPPTAERFMVEDKDHADVRVAVCRKCKEKK